MSRMFGDRVHEFVLSNDIMDQEIFEELLKLVERYLRQEVKVAYFAVLDEVPLDGKGRSLRTLWSSRDEQPSYSVGARKKYESHTAYAFGENKPIWVVGDRKKPLHAAESYKDLWSGSDDLPAYNASSTQEVRTSVMHPLRRDGKAIGLVEFGTEAYVEPTPASLTEAVTLADVLSRAYRMYDVRKGQRDSSRKALRMLERALKKESWTSLAQPRMFVAFPGGEGLEGNELKKHEAVISTIKLVIDEFSHKLEPDFWDNQNDSGDIPRKVIDSITRSDFGICYLSKPLNGDYQDNSNVLFEAGMMQALTHSRNSLLRGWIPIREKDAPDLPFDIAAERIVWVERDGKGKIQGLDDELRKRISTLVEQQKPGD